MGGIAVGGLLGTADGLVVARLRLDVFVVTIGGSSIVLGAVFYQTYGIPVHGVPRDFSRPSAAARCPGFP